MYNWPVAQIENALDKPIRTVCLDEVRSEIKNAGYGPLLAEFLAEFYSVANAGSFYDGALRVLPFNEVPKKSPSLVAWNDPKDWKQYGPAKCQNCFFFLSNAFGDLLGVPLIDNDIGTNTTCVLWTDKYQLEESKLGWDQIFRKFLSNQNSMAAFLARLKEYHWAVEALGRPSLEDCFSWNLLPSMGGHVTLDNLRVVPTYVNLSFSLQVLSEFAKTGRPPGKVELC